ncbi:LysM peptidoglycan-binding domain-containing protein [Acidaminobacter sp. JC074]|uniref:5'-nucleotidase C-terminal domain-containing protein n=1 Tax=Acidaminobacter sp. JC074 TaxID=2530199 RepID=UPI001F10AF70|nr:5'-nucleotidase C-terminal domain-containing protein [Acidaminobacter sp. JC074]MCH4888489.1 LysM peptidoglycan-binding domain-containing protein [Acidaminobacter sp. JC074]
MMKYRKLSLFLVLVMLMSSLPLAAFAEDTYVIEEGDVLWKIAQKYGRTYEDLAVYNDIEDPNMIYAGDTIKIPEGEMKKITVLGTADMHGRIYAYEYAIDAVDKDAGLAKIQTLVKEVRANEENVILMDVGDTVQDNSAELFNDLPVHPMVQAMNEMDFDIWALGNHEFNFEKSFLERNIAAFEGEVLSANIYNEGTDTRFVDGYTIMDVDGVRVAIVGMIPPHVPIWEASAPSHFAGLEFTDITEETGKVIKELEGKYDVLVGAYHLGPDAYKGMPGIEDIAAAYPQFDVIFGGHAHSKYQNEVNGVKLIEPGKYGWALAKADLYIVKDEDGYDVAKVATENMETYTVTEDQGILDKFANVHTESMADANIVVGTVTEDYVANVDYITGEASVTTMPTTQIEDTALIDLINDVQLFYTGAQISSAAAFKTDMNLVAGDFKKKDVANIYKYPNTLTAVNITGANLLDYMEWSASYYNTYMHGDVTVSFNPSIRGYNYDMFAGMTYGIDISKPEGERIVNPKFDGEAIDPAATYTLAVNNYRFGTLMNNGWVTEADKIYDSYEEMQDAGRIRDLIIKYIDEEKGGVAEPSVDNNWSIVNADLNHPLKDEIMKMIVDGDILIPRSEDGRTPNVKAINVYELMQEGIIDEVDELTILHTNDMHGFFNYGKYDGMGAALLKTKIDMMMALSDNTLLLDGGDALQGHNLVTLSKGETGTKIMDLLGYDAMAAGNHEFDYGADRLLELEAMIDTPILAANVETSAGEVFLTPYIIKEMDGYTVGIFGLATPETVYKSHPNNTKGLTIVDPKEAAASAVAMLEDKVDIIIAVAHLGNEGEYTSESVIKAVDGIDVLVDGHSHTEYPEGIMVNDTLIVQAEDKTKNLGIAKLAIKDGVVVDKVAYMFTKKEAMMLTPDAEMEALLEDIEEINAPIEKEVVATAPYQLDGERADVRTGETNLGNMIAEALLDISGADVALTNGGGIRTSIDAGEVTKGEVLTVLPFGNTVRVLEITGADIIAAIENGITDYPEAKGAFPHIAGMTVEFDATKDAGSRVTKLMVGDALVDEAKTYTIATNDFLSYGGDGYKMFVGKTVVAEFGAMDEVLIDYMNEKGFEKAPVTDRIKDISNDVSFYITRFAA